MTSAPRPQRSDAFVATTFVRLAGFGLGTASLWRAVSPRRAPQWPASRMRARNIVPASAGYGASRNSLAAGNSALELLGRVRNLRRQLLSDSAAVDTAYEKPDGRGIAEVERTIADIVHEIRLCDESYYGAEPNPRVRDEEYDELVMLLGELERIYPDLATEDSPSVTVGAAAPALLPDGITPRFAPHRHATRMLSLGNAYSRADVTAFLARVEKLQSQLNSVSTTDDNADTLLEPIDFAPVCVEAKVDGVALALCYRQGNLVAAATRGNGDVGDDVTANVRAALVGRGVPAELPEAVNVDVRGEVYITGEEFLELNAANETPLANARNAAAGGLKHKDPQESARRKLRFVAYECLQIPEDVVAAEGAGANREGVVDERPIVSFWPTQIDTLVGLGGWGFGTMPVFELCRTEDEVMAFACEQESSRAKLPFDVDGVVIKVNDSVLRHGMGSTAKSPRGAIAYKFAAIGAETVLESVVMQVSRTGSINPVALLRPVEIGGVTVRRATLHNFDEIERLDVCVGDTVLVQRGGDVIPKIKVVKEKASASLRKAIAVPSRCPACGGPVTVSKTEGAATSVLCQDSAKCVAQTHGRILHFARRDAMDISGLGPQTVIKLTESGTVGGLADLFALTMDDILNLEGFKEKSATSLYNAIQNAKTRSLERVIIGLGIPGVGRASAQSLAGHAKSVKGLIDIASTGSDGLMCLPAVAEKSASSIVSFLQQAQIREELLALSGYLAPSSVTEFHVVDGPSSLKIIGELLDDTDTDSSGSNRLSVKSMMFALTGKLSNMSREDARRQILFSGGKLSSTVSKRTDVLVIGDEPGQSKLQKAARLGVRTMTGSEFENLFAADSSPSNSETGHDGL